MSDNSNNPKVYAVRTLKEARRVLLSPQKTEMRIFFKRAFISTWVQIANAFLRLLKFILFKKGGYSRKEFKAIVVYTHGILGDNLAALPALAALKKRYTNATVTVVADLGPLPKAPTELFQSVNCVDNLIVLDKHPVSREGLRLILDTKLKEIRCDLFVNLAPYGNRGWFKAVVREMIFARWINAKYAVGFHISTKVSKGSLNCVQHMFIKNEPRRSREVLRELGLTPIEDIDLLPRNPVAKEAIFKKIQNKVNDMKAIFIINPGANLEVKQWPADRFGKVAEWIAKHYQANVVITGTTSEKNIALEVVEASGGFAINMAGETSVQELIELLRLSKACITNDTGTMHVSAMIGLPTVAIFGTRISPTWWFPNGDNIISIFCPMKCSYCYNDYCESKKCLKNIGISDVIKSVEEILSDKDSTNTKSIPTKN
jgi:ADP-heptose:LPS heptosyltransferase